jgi:hypothetical protein
MEGSSDDTRPPSVTLVSDGNNDNPNPNVYSPPSRRKVSNNFTLYGIVLLVILIGTSVATAFLALGIVSENKDMESQFQASASDLVHSIQTAWESYVTAASMIVVNLISLTAGIVSVKFFDI